MMMTMRQYAKPPHMLPNELGIVIVCVFFFYGDIYVIRV